MRTSINLWSLRDFDRPLPRIVELVAEAGYDGVQFSGGLGDASVEELLEVLEATGLEVTAPHVDMASLEEALDATAESYGSLGSDTLVIPYLEEVCFEDAAAVSATVDRIESVRDDLAEHDIGLDYHNHSAEFQPHEDGVAFDRLVAETDDLGFEVDVAWVHEAGHDPIQRLRQVAGRCTFVHMRDVTAEGDDAELGDGVVDLEACADTAREIGAEWFIYERIDPEDFVDSIEYGAEYLGRL